MNNLAEKAKQRNIYPYTFKVKKDIRLFFIWLKKVEESNISEALRLLITDSEMFREFEKDYQNHKKFLEEELKQCHVIR